MKGIDLFDSVYSNTKIEEGVKEIVTEYIEDKYANRGEEFKDLKWNFISSILTSQVRAEILKYLLNDDINGIQDDF